MVLLRIGILVLLLANGCKAVHKGTAIKSDAEVPYAVGFLAVVDESEESPGYKDCLAGDDDVLGSFCGGGLISEGVFLTAAHCFEEGGQKASNGKLNLANLRVGLGYRCGKAIRDCARRVCPPLFSAQLTLLASVSLPPAPH